MRDKNEASEIGFEMKMYLNIWIFGIRGVEIGFEMKMYGHG